MFKTQTIVAINSAERKYLTYIVHFADLGKKLIEFGNIETKI